MALAGAMLVLAATGGNAIAQTEEVRQARPVRQTGVELTDAQNEQIAQLQKQHREASAEAAAEINKAKAEVQSLMVLTDTDLNALQRAMNTLSELENAQKIQGMRHAQAFQDILTDEQKSQMRAGRGGAMSFFMQSRMGRQGHMVRQGHMGRSRSMQNRNQASNIQGRSMTRFRDQQSRSSRSRTRGNRPGSAPPPMQGRFGNVVPNESGMRMRARIHAPGNTPPPSAPPADN